jgi:FkbM family methyltransferase
MVLDASKKYIREFKGNNIVVIKYLAFLTWSIITLPFRKLASFIDPSERRYSKMVEGKSELIMPVLGSKMILPTADKGLSKEIFLHGIREANAVEVMKKELKEGMNIIDAGANIGYYVLLESQKASKVFAIEPNPRSFALLKRNVKINKRNNVYLKNIAAGDKRGKIPFVLDESWNLSRVLKKGEKISNGKIKNVKIDTLDNLFKGKKIDLIRMDVEGYELSILKGAVNLIKSNPKIKIFLEFHADMFNPEKREEFINFCKQNKLRIKHFFHKEARVDEPYSKNFSSLRNSKLTAYHLMLDVIPNAKNN